MDPADGLTDLARLASRCLPLSRMVFLGSRDPRGESCVKPVLTGSVTDQVPPDMGDVDGGPGTKLATLLFVRGDEVTSAMDDHRWHQSRLRTYLENERRLNALAREAAEELHAAAVAVARAVAADALTDDPRPAGCTDESTWPGYCLCRLDEAVRERDAAAARRWSQELETATFWLVDLHRWLDFLAANFLAAIDFQRLSLEPFARIDRAGGKYAVLSAPSCLPAGMLTQHGRANFLEIERQAERIFSMPADRIAELRTDRNLAAESLLVPPVRRGTFLAYLAALSPGNRRTLAAAARSPFECAFLVNMLYRADTAEFVELQCEVLRRFDRRCPDATVEQLMGVLFYRGHSFAALEWADRFQPSLVSDTADLGGTDAAAFAAACGRAYAAFDRGGSYGLTLSLRDSLARGVFDCVRLTDLAVSLYRNSGRSGIGHVRWLAGTEGHSVAACWGHDAAGPVIVADPLIESDPPRPWPEAYFAGATWPEMLRDNPKPYAAELYVRGLDQYVWAAGYVIRGERAGTLVEAAIPYLSRFGTAGERRVFPGPYPDF